MKTVISRKYGQLQTSGRLVSFDGDIKLLDAVTIEPPDNGNQRITSCIPEGVYEVEKIHSPKFGDCFLVKNVPGRDGIEFHPGNFESDTSGCILPGRDFVDLNEDGSLDVTESTITLKKMLRLMPNGFKLWII